MALLAQTTLSHDEWRGLMEGARERFPDLWMPNRSDLCFATTNRQAALQGDRRRSADAVVVIGSANSSNTVALEKVARASGCPGSCCGSTTAAEVPGDLTGTVGVTAGASAPESLVDAVIERLAPEPRGRAVARSPPRTSTSLRHPSCASSSGPWPTTLGVLCATPGRTARTRPPTIRSISAADVLGALAS